MSREYPNDLEKEKKVLSAMMLEGGKIIPEVTAILKAEEFYRAEHQIIYRATVNAYNNNPGVPIDILMVEDELERRDELKKVSRVYLFALLEYEFTTLRAVKFAQDIKEKARLRGLIDACEEMKYTCFEEQKSSSELVSEFEDKLGKVTSTMPTAAENLGTVLTRTLENAIARRSNGGRLIGTTTGYWDLDELTGGLKKSDLLILAARPSMGKTALGINIAVNAAKEIPVLVYSLEMSKEQLGQRILSGSSGVAAMKIATGRISDTDLDLLVNAHDYLSRLKMHIDDTSCISLAEIKMRSRRRKSKEDIGLIVIDYLQLVKGSGSYKNNRVQEVSEITRELKGLAKELDIPILAISQLSRSVEQRADKRPQLSDLRESGSIEQDADIVMFLYRDEYYNREEAAVRNKAELIIAKNRNGGTGKMMLQFESARCLFRSYTEAAG